MVCRAGPVPTARRWRASYSAGSESEIGAACQRRRSQSVGQFTDLAASPRYVGIFAGERGAVELALAWLAEHQFPTGGWNFDHRLGPCRGRCSNPGKPLVKAVNAATAIALLPFIDHGNTHQTGHYQQHVAAGLRYLIARIDKDGSLWEPDGWLYSQALGILAFCEDLRIGREAPGQAADTPYLALSLTTEKKGTHIVAGAIALTGAASPVANRSRSFERSSSGSCSTGWFLWPHQTRLPSR